jgi:hypothetical protein
MTRVPQIIRMEQYAWYMLTGLNKRRNTARHS